DSSKNETDAMRKLEKSRTRISAWLQAFSISRRRREPSSRDTVEELQTEATIKRDIRRPAKHHPCQSSWAGRRSLQLYLEKAARQSVERFRRARRLSPGGKRS